MLRLFNAPAELYQPASTADPDGAGPAAEQASVLQMAEGETIYDYDWYPFMSSYTPASCWWVASHVARAWKAAVKQSA